MESKGGGSGGSDGGRGSSGGEREWCRVMERGSSPGLIVAHVCSSLPTSAPCFRCLRMIACVCVSSPMSMHRCLCLRIVACVHASLPVSVRRCPHPFTFVGGRFSSRAVDFVCGWSVSFVGMGGSLHSWVVVFIWGWSIFVCGQWHSVVVGGCWWVVVSPQGWCRHVVTWPLWSHCGARWCVSQLSHHHLVATFPAVMWHHWCQ